MNRRVFTHARVRVLLLGGAGVGLGLLVLSQSPQMLDPAWHTEASRGAWLNAVPPALRVAFMLSVGAVLVVSGAANVWVVLRRSAALILDAEGVTHLPVLQRRVTTPWLEITRLEQRKGRLLLHRLRRGPLVIGYDWFEAAPRELRAAVEAHWRAAHEPMRAVCGPDQVTSVAHDRG